MATSSVIKIMLSRQRGDKFLLSTAKARTLAVREHIVPLPGGLGQSQLLLQGKGLFARGGVALGLQPIGQLVVDRMRHTVQQGTTVADRHAQLRVQLQPGAAADPRPARLRFQAQQPLARVAARPALVGLGLQMARQQVARLRPGQRQRRRRRRRRRRAQPTGSQMVLPERHAGVRRASPCLLDRPFRRPAASSVVCPSSRGARLNLATAFCGFAAGSRRTARARLLLRLVVVVERPIDGTHPADYKPNSWLNRRRRRPGSVCVLRSTHHRFKPGRAAFPGGAPGLQNQ